MNTSDRSAYLDTVKLLLTVLVVVVHAAITYGAAGCAATVLLGELVLQRIPGVRRVMY
jgi:hypothetical protein